MSMDQNLIEKCRITSFKSDLTLKSVPDLFQTDLSGDKNRTHIVEKGGQDYASVVFLTRELIKTFGNGATQFSGACIAGHILGETKHYMRYSAH